MVLEMVLEVSSTVMNVSIIGNMILAKCRLVILIVGEIGQPCSLHFFKSRLSFVIWKKIK
jgi:hypothetical protein